MNNVITQNQAPVHIEKQIEIHFHPAPPENKPPAWGLIMLSTGILLFLASGHTPAAAIEPLIAALIAMIHMLAE